ncbi:hypothetical protein A7981_04345 [Methylovorus sp. MM2]|nr:hypothetical protein A7981_04345 [Methylovorus sp. MM2]
MSKYQPALPIVDGSPRWLDYVGGILADDDKKGTDPATCGMSADSPFTLSDLDINYVPYSISYQNTVQNTANGTASTDIIKALKNIGVSGEVLKQASANIKTTLDRFQTITVKTKADFVVVKLSTSALNKLRAISVPKRLEDCSAHLSSNQYVRLIRGISGYWVKSASEDTTTRNDLTAELNAALTGVISSEQLVSLNPKITSISNSLLNTVSGEHFVIIAMTFYEP